jgi:hypothetical protein
MQAVLNNIVKDSLSAARSKCQSMREANITSLQDGKLGFLVMAWRAAWKKGGVQGAPGM